MTRRRGTMPGGYASVLEFRTNEIGFVAANRGGISRTATGGLTWKNLIYADGIGDFSSTSPRKLFAVLQAGLLRSDDAGRHWRRIYPPGFAEPQGSQILFFSAKRAIAFGATEPLGEPRTVLATRDGGRTWSLRGEVTPLRGLVEQVFRFGNVVLVTDGSTLARSDDRGRSWRKVSTLSARWHAVSFISSRIGFVADRRGRLLRTDDGGSTWNLVVAQTTRELEGVVFVSEKEALLVDYGPPPPDDGRKHLGPRPRLLHSGDGGRTWGELPTPVQNITAVTVLDADHWWIFANAECSLRRPCQAGRILRTADGGDHWDLIRLPHALSILAGNFVSAKVGFAGSPWNGFYRTDDGGVTWRAVYPR